VDVYLLDPLRSTAVVEIVNEMKRDSDKSNPGDPDSMKLFLLHTSVSKRQLQAQLRWVM